MNESTSQRSLPDGPCHPQTWRHAGSTLAPLCLQPLTWNLVEFLWNKRDRTATFQELAEPVWRDHALTLGSAQIGRQRTLANRFFQKNGIPFLIRVNSKDRRVHLCCTKA